jgi:hypothetical protein
VKISVHRARVAGRRGGFGANGTKWLCGSGSTVAAAGAPRFLCSRSLSPVSAGAERAFSCELQQTHQLAERNKVSDDTIEELTAMAIGDGET